MEGRPGYETRRRRFAAGRMAKLRVDETALAERRALTDVSSSLFQSTTMVPELLEPFAMLLFAPTSRR